MGIVKLLSLLEDHIMQAIIENGKVKYLDSVPSYVWQNNTFCFENPLPEAMVFSHFHQELDADIPYELKSIFIKSFADYINKNIKQELTEKTIIIVPDCFPEWALWELMNELSLLGFNRCLIIRKVFLGIIFLQIKNFIPEEHELKNLTVNSSWKKCEEYWYLEKLQNENFTINQIAEMIRYYFETHQSIWAAKWVVSLGFFDMGGTYQVLVEENQKTPFRKYFHFQVLSQNPETVLVILAKSSPDVMIEVMRIPIPENNKLIPIDYTINIDFTSGWYGQITILKEDCPFMQSPINLPFLTYQL